MDIPKLLEPLKKGEADLVLGSRFKFKSGIKKGAMPWHHQYIGNPVLTWIFNRANKSNLSDTHSGFRAFTKEAYDKMRTDLKTTGMEFASEMLEVAIKNNLKIAEVPITYYPRPEGSEPNLSSFSDGWRHLKHILLRAPTLLFLIPGFILFALGMLLVLLIWNPFNLWVPRLGIHSMIAGVGSGYCWTYAARDRIANDILFVFLECDWRGRIKCKIKVQNQSAKCKYIHTTQSQLPTNI